MARPDWIDYRKVKDAVSIESVLERILGGEVGIQRHR